MCLKYKKMTETKIHHTTHTLTMKHNYTHIVSERDVSQLKAWSNTSRAKTSKARPRKHTPLTAHRRHRLRFRGTRCNQQQQATSVITYRQGAFRENQTENLWNWNLWFCHGASSLWSSESQSGEHFWKKILGSIERNSQSSTTAVAVLQYCL